MILNSIDDLVVFHDPEMNILWTNRAAELSVGSPSGGLVGRYCWEIWHQRNTPCGGCPVLSTLKTGESQRSEIESPDGRAWLIRSYPIKNDDGTVKGIVELCQNITDRKRADEALRRSEIGLKRSQEMAHLGSWELDLVNDRLTWSDEVYRIFGLRPQELRVTYQTFLDAVHPEDRAAVDEAYRSSIREERDSYEFEHRVVRKSDGGVCVVHEKCEHFRDASGEITRSQGMVHDITERKQIEEALRVSEEKYRIVADNTYDWEFWLAPDDNFLYMSPSCERITGYSVREFTDDPELFLKIIHPDDRRIFLQHQQELYNAHGDLEFRVTTKGGETVFIHHLCQPVFDGNGRFLGRRGSNRDITERKRADAEREIAVDFLSLVNEAGSTRELIQRSIAFVQQRSGCEAVGIRLREGDDYPYYEARGFRPGFIRKENLLCNRDSHGRVLRDEGGFPMLDCMCGNVITGRFDPSRSFFTARGSFWTNSTTELLATTTENDRLAKTRNVCNTEGYESLALIALLLGEERLGVLQMNDRRKGFFTLEQITMWERLADHLAVALAKFQAEEALQDAKAQAELYLDLMSHDINNMHQIALGYLELARELPADEAGKGELDRPIEVLRRSAELINNVRKLQKLQEGVFHTREIDVAAVVADVRREFGTVPGKTLAMNLRCDRCLVRANELLYDVFSNLAGNAIKHTKPLASIDIDLDRVTDAGRRYCRVLVEDDGPGIPDDLKAIIFNRASKGTAKSTGMGLGLYLVKSLVTSYDGQVWVEDRVPKDYRQGARFVVLLPEVDIDQRPKQLR